MLSVGKGMRMKKIGLFFLYAFSGFFCAVPLVCPKLWVFFWVGPVPVLLSELYFNRESTTLPRAWGRGFLFFFCYGYTAFSWFWGIYPIDSLGFTRGEALAVVILATLGIPALQGMFSAFVFVYCSFVNKKGYSRRHPILSGMGAACLWAFFEWLQTLTFLGVPWGRAAVGQGENLPIIQCLSLFGPYFLTFLCIFTASLLAFSAYSFVGRKRKEGGLAIAFAFLLFFGNYTYGALKINLSDLSKGESVKVAAIQGNVLYEDRFPDKAAYIEETYRALTLEACVEGAELILWPETALPYDISSDEGFTDYILSVQRESSADIVATFFNRDTEGLKNVAVAVTADGMGESFYEKRALVPFGEYLPMEGFINAVCPPLAQFTKLNDPVTAGDRAVVLETESLKLCPLICYDSVFEELCRQGVSLGGNIICISTNDSWFSGSCALCQHEMQGRLRCVENGKYGVRAANTGNSSVISPTGELLAMLGEGETGYITADIYEVEETTLYTKIGNAVIPVFIVYTLIITLAAGRRKTDGYSNR